MKLSTDKVADTLQVAQYASICTSEKGIPNEIRETRKGHDVVLTESGDFFEFIRG